MGAIRAVTLSLALCSLSSFVPAPAAGQSSCAAEQPAALLPKDPTLCARLASVIRQPADLPLEKYEDELGSFLRNFCHRDKDAGWKRDKRVRDTGPFTATLQGSQWTGSYHGTHAPVVIWYSPEMFAWMKANRPVETAAPDTAASIPDGAVIVKEMFPAPAAACAGVDPTLLLPTSGAAVMVRDREAAQDGWFWGYFGLAPRTPIIRRARRTAIPTWASASTASTAMPRRRTT